MSADTDSVVILWVGAILAILFLTFGPMFDAPRRGCNAWPWIIAGLVAGPLSGIAYYASRRGVRMAAERNAEIPRDGGAV